MICHIDIETYSETDLPKAGVYRYAEDPATEILCVCYAFDDEPVHLWVPWEDHELPLELVEALGGLAQNEYLHFGTVCPDELYDYMDNGGKCAAHNAEFERTILNGHAGQLLGIPETKIRNWHCTAAKAAASGLPRALDGVCKALNTKHQKQTDGKAHMMALSKPRRKDSAPRWTPQEDPDRFKSLYLYCVDDVEAEREVDLTLPDLSPYEQQIWVLDQVINRRGIKIDLPQIHTTMKLRDEYKKVIEAQCVDLTGFKPTQTGKLAEWIREREPLENLTAPVVKDKLAEPDIDPGVRQALRMRTSHAMKAPSKLEAMIRAVCKDERLHGMFLYHGGAPGRWASRLVQLQNMFRSVLKNDDLAIKTIAMDDMDWLKTLFGDYDLMKVFASVMRGMIIPSEGKDLMCMDFSSIEARIAAWLAGSEKLLEIYRTHGMVYAHTAAQIYGLDENDMDVLLNIENNEPYMRLVGKIGTLSLQFGGGGMAYLKMGAQYGLDVDFERGEEIKNEWRANNKEIVGYWYELEQAWQDAVTFPGSIYKAGIILFRVNGDFMEVRLPSGRLMKYYKPRYEGGDCSYEGIDTYTRQWTRVKTWGGKLLQNCLHGDTEILTDTGWKKLIDYKTTDRLWDGEQWVWGGKLICHGRKEVIDYAGVQLTGDHRVLTTEGWKAANECERFDRQNVSLPDNYFTITLRWETSALERSVRLRQDDSSLRQSDDALKRPIPEVLRMSNQEAYRHRKPEAWHVSSPGVSCVGFNARALYFTDSSSLGELWRSWHNSIPRMVGKLRELLAGYGRRVQEGLNFRSHRQREGLFESELSMGHCSGTEQQQTRQRENTDTLGRNDSSQCGKEVGDSPRHASVEIEAQLARGRSVHRGKVREPVPVYDILNAGPLNRFTVRGDTGEIFIVHNCTEAIGRDRMAHGMMTLERSGKYPILGTVHDEVITEPNEGEGSIEEGIELMCRAPSPDWSKGLPVGASGFRAKRYKKE